MTSIRQISRQSQSVPANITTAAGDTCLVVSEDGSNNVRVVWYQRKDGTALAGGTAGTSAALATEILADSPTGYWKCDDSGSTLADSSGNGYTMTLVGTPVVNHSYLLPNDTTKYLRVGVGASGASITSSLGTSPPLTGDWSLVCVVVLESTLSTTLFSLGLPSSETEANNLQVNAFISVGNVPSTNWESGAGTDRVTAAPTANATRGCVHHFAFVKDGTADTVTFYRNGKQIGQPVSYSH